LQAQGENTLDVLDEGFVYDHEASVESCKDSVEELVIACWPLGRLLLFPEDHDE